MRFLIVIGLGLVSLSADVLAQANEVRGLDFRTYLSIQRGMTEGQLLSIAGNPDLLADQGFVASDSNATLAVKTYTYLPTPADPYTTTITLTGGTVTEIQRDRTVSPSADVPAQTSGIRGLDFRSYLSIQRGMTEGQLLGIAGNPDLLADQGFVASDSNATLAVKTYTYLPTPADLYATTITLTGGTVTDIRRDRAGSSSADVPAQTSGIRGLDFRTYLSIQRGMTEGQLLGIAGNPDLLADQGFVVSDPNTQLAIKTYTYLPTSADPYTTTITLVAGKVAKIERERKF